MADIYRLRNNLSTLTPLYTEDPVDMRYLINNMVDMIQELVQVVEEQADRLEMIQSTDALESDMWDLNERVGNLDDRIERLDKIAESKRGEKGDIGARGIQGKEGPRGEKGPEGDVPEHPDVKEALEKIKDLEEQVEELTLAIEELEK